MFKGIFRILISYSLILFSLILGVSLWEFSPLDLNYYSSDSSLVYQNILDILGSNIAASFVFFYGKATWVWVIFSLLIGIRILTGISPKTLLIRFGITHYIALMLATFLALITNNFSFVTGGIFGALIASMLTSILPNVFWIPLFLLSVLLGIFMIWSFPKQLLNKFLVYRNSKLQTLPVSIQEAISTEQEIYEENIENEVLPQESSELLLMKSPTDQIEKFYDSYENSSPYQSQVPEFLQEIHETEEEKNPHPFLSKKPISFNPSPDLLRDVDIDLLTPYMNAENPLYNKLEYMNISTTEDDKPNPTLQDTLKEIVETIDDLDQSSQPLVPNSQWVRESGVSMKDFIRKPIQRLSFSVSEETMENDTDVQDHFNHSNNTNDLNISTEIQHAKNDSTDILSSLVTDSIEYSADVPLEEEVIQHTSNFPPVSTADSTFMLLPQMNEEKISEPFTLDLNSTPTMSSFTPASSLEITESERLLIEGVERTQKKQEEKLQTMKEKVHAKQQELAQRYYSQQQEISSPQFSSFESVEEGLVKEELVKEIPNDFHQVLTTSFALHDFEQEILELKKRANVDTVSQALSDDTFLHSTRLENKDPLHNDSNVDEFKDIVTESINETIDEELIHELMLPSVDETSIENISPPSPMLLKVENETEDSQSSSISAEMAEQKMAEQLVEDYESPQFASLIRLELGEVSLPDITELTASDNINVINMDTVFSENEIIHENPLENNWNIEEKSEHDTLRGMIQEFQQFDTKIGEDSGSSNMISVSSMPFEESLVVNFDDIISEMESHMNNYEDNNFISKQNQLPIMNVTPSEEIVSVSSIKDSTIGDNFSPDDFLVHIIHNEQDMFDQITESKLSAVEDELEAEELNVVEDELEAEELNVVEDELEAEELNVVEDELEAEELNVVEDELEAEELNVVEDELEAEELNVVEDELEAEELNVVEDELAAEELNVVEDELEAEELNVVEDELEAEELNVVEDELEAEELNVVEDELAAEELNVVEDELEAEELNVVEDELEAEELNVVEDELEAEENSFVLPAIPNKEILLNNTESMISSMTNDTYFNSDFDELNEKESALMPSIVTEGHLVKPLAYPIEVNKEFIFPDIEDLEPNTDQISKIEEDEEIETTMKMIEDTYESFNINMQVVDYNRGPTITRFELEPPSGLKLRTILNLQDDLALQAGTSNLRIISPVEGRSLIGIEVPNKVRRNFLIREQIESSNFTDAKSELPLILGVDVGGKEIIGDLATTPHLLIAGTTGSGKSVYVNALIMGLLFKLSAEDLKFIMIDPKMVELELYNGIPHLLAPIITKPEEAMAALEWAVQEMDRRYKLLSELGVRNIVEYKQQALNHGYEKLPYIVIIVDEFANLMLRAPKDTEKHISRLASMSRAVGIHLVLATQRPSVDVVTGVIKANFPSRIALRVSSKIDSRTIIDRNGAETLLGRGDMLFMSPNYMEPIRIQSPFASSEDVARTVMRIKKNGAPDYAINFSEVLAKQDDDTNNDNARTDAMNDSLFEEVLRFAVENGEISASGIQRRFRVGYNRASRLIETMKDLKIISPPTSAGKGWMINITKDEIFKYID